MDSKALKTGVFFNENIFCESLEQPIDVDFTLPDYCPDISKIFKCKASPTITSKGINGKNITIDGNVTITLLYCDRDNNLCSYEYIYPFSKIKEIFGETENCELICTIKCDYLNCRAITGRKLDVHGAVSLNICVFKRSENEIVSDYDSADMQLKRSVVPATVPMVFREKQMIIEEEISINNAQISVLRIIRYDAVPTITDCKVLKDKVVLKGEIGITVLYVAEGIRVPQVLKTTLPFSQIVEMPGITELCKCDHKCEISFLEIRPATTYGGENRGFFVNAKLLLKCESYCVNDIAVIEDAFSTKYQTNLIKSKLPFKQICKNVKENCFLKKKVELNENIVSVVDIWCEKTSQKVKFENGNMCLSALLLVGMVVCDSEDNISFCEKTLELDFKCPVECDNVNLSADPDIEIISVGFTILSANCLELRIEACVSGAIYKTDDISLITDIQIDTEKPCHSGKKGGMVICFTEGECSVWSVAKKYNASIEEILNINGVEEDDLNSKAMLLVPIN